jgi:hypothetical protein
MVLDEADEETLGVVVFAVTTTDAVELHPLDGSVTVSTKVPESLTVGLEFEEENPLGPTQEKTTPLVVDAPETVTVILVHVMVGEEATLMFGIPAPLSTLTVSSEVQPVLEFVTVTV